MGILKSKTQHIACPNCGTNNPIQHSEVTKVYLDGTPQMSMEQLLAQCAVCKQCHLIYTADAMQNAKQIIQNPEYTEACAQDYSNNVEQKIALLHAAFRPWYIASYYARYYHQQQDEIAEQKWLNTAIDNIVTGKDQHAAEYSASELPQLKLQKNARVYLYADVRLVDLYRRAQRFDEAQAQLDNIRRRRVMARPDFYTYLDFEEQLIKRKDSALY